MSERTAVYSLKTNGIQILEEPQEFAVPMIPIVPVIGEEFAVGDKKIRHSVIRFAKEPQQLYNYWLSTQTEHLALQPKAPYIATNAMVAKYQGVWKTANTSNHAVLVYDPDPNAPGMRPQREQPPASSPAHTEQVLRARDAMKATTGIYDAGLGSQSNETSGRAIMARQRESDVGTSEFLDNLAASVSYTGKILLKLIPKIYDTPRLVRILGEDGAEAFKQINQPYPDPVTGEVKEFNLALGEFEAQVSTGPSYTTRRQEAAESMLAFVQTAPQSAQFVMDLIARNMDWPGADEFAARFKKALPPNMQPDPSTPQEQEVVKAAQQKAEEAEQIAKRGQMAQIMKTEADTADKQAETAKTELEAKQLALELMMQNGALQQIVQEQVQAALASMFPVQAPINGGYM
jgi:hypothetical protein